VVFLGKNLTVRKFLHLLNEILKIHPDSSFRVNQNAMLNPATNTIAAPDRETEGIGIMNIQVPRRRTTNDMMRDRIFNLVCIDLSLS